MLKLLHSISHRNIWHQIQKQENFLKKDDHSQMRFFFTDQIYIHKTALHWKENHMIRRNMIKPDKIICKKSTYLHMGFQSISGPLAHFTSAVWERLSIIWSRPTPLRSRGGRFEKGMGHSQSQRETVQRQKGQHGGSPG